MDTKHYLSNDTLLNSDNRAEKPVSLSDNFACWLSNGNTKKISSQAAVDCLDKVSEYLIAKKISCSIWEISKPNLYKTVYQKVLNAKLFRVMERNTYKTFIVVGQLYLKFLKEKPFENSVDSSKIKISNNQFEPTAETTFSAEDDIKIGAYIRSKMMQLSNSGYVFSEIQLENICDLQWGKQVLKLAAPHPFAKIVHDTIDVSELSKDEYGYNRYWNKVFSFGNVNLIFFSQWYEKNRIYFNEWFSTLGVNSADVSVKLNSSSTDDINIANQNKIEHILNAKFKNGYRTESSIDFERFKNFYLDEYSEEFSEDANILNHIIKCVAVLFDDRAYVYDDTIILTVRTFLEQLDFPCVYINVFFEKFSNELYAFGIFSIDMLKAFIERHFLEIIVKWDYIYLQPDISTSSLIRDVFNERESWSVKDLYDRLPCLKQDTIRAAINSVDYLRIDAGVYTHIDNMELPDCQGEKILQFVNEKLQNRNYVIANEIDLSEFERLNPHCPFSAIRDAVFTKFLSKDFSKSGQVITKLGEKLRVLDILEQYCHDAQTVSFDELNSLEASFDPKGQSHSACLIAAHNVMVRVSDELFVAESKINFDTYKIDEAIALYCRENFVPLKNVTDFSLFPYAGYPWNLYLLESYMRKFSNIFKYDVRAVNSANIGVIVRKSFEYSEYDNIISVALAKSTLNLSSKKEIGDFLFNSGYIGWRNLGKNEEKILDNARKIREGCGV